MDVVVGETDYSSHAVVYYQKLRQMSMKLYGAHSVQGALGMLEIPPPLSGA